VLPPVSMPARGSWEKVREITCSRCRAKPYAAAPANAGTDGKSLRERCFLLAGMRRFRGHDAPRAAHRRLFARTFAPPASGNFRETTQKCANGAGIGSPFLDMAPLKFAISPNPLTGLPARLFRKCYGGSSRLPAPWLRARFSLQRRPLLRRSGGKPRGRRARSDLSPRHPGIAGWRPGRRDRPRGE
jgi:hypothetical protein